ncbi:MAG: TonB C-terminal domain-containing protein, partial [Methylocystis sp.]
KKLCSISAIYLFCSSLGMAQENKPPVNHSTETKPATAEAIQAAEKVDRKKPKSTLSLANYKALIASKIAAKARGKNSAGAGEVQATFRVNEEGKIDQIQIKKSTNPGLATHVKNILSSVQAPPPPEGAIYLGQPFKFN